MKKRVYYLSRVAGIAATVAALASPAAAQTPATSPPAQTPTVLLGTPAFARLVKDKTVLVTSADGSQQKGRVTLLSATGMTVNSQALPFEQITRVQKVSHRTVRYTKYTLVGFGIGAAVGGVLAGFAECVDDPDGCGPIIIPNVVIGTAAGAAICALVSRGDRDVIYTAPKRTTMMAFAPIVSPTRKGVAFSVTWR